MNNNQHVCCRPLPMGKWPNKAFGARTETAGGDSAIRDQTLVFFITTTHALILFVPTVPPMRRPNGQTMATPTKTLVCYGNFAVDWFFPSFACHLLRHLLKELMRSHYSNFHIFLIFKINLPFSSFLTITFKINPHSIPHYHIDFISLHICYLYALNYSFYLCKK